MDNGRLWAPWRLKYIRQEVISEGCFLCGALSENRDRENLVLLRGKSVFVVVNKYPYNNGHLMVVPNRHIKHLESLTDDEDVELMRVTKRMIKVIKKVLNPDGFNVGMNLEKPAGAGLEGHIHLHVVPRCVGDTNFMPVVSNTKVISHSLEELYDLIFEELQ